MTDARSHNIDFSFFNPDEYLNEYYRSVRFENNELLRFFVKASKIVPEGSTFLEYGGGPTIYQLVSFTPRLGSICFTDYVGKNIIAVKDWIKKEEHSHDWTPFIAAALQHEGIEHPSAEQIKEREYQIRAQLMNFGYVDAFNRHLDEVPLQQYDVVSSNFVAESIAFDETSWRKCLDSLLSYVKLGGILCMTAIRGATYWKTGDKNFPAFSVNARSIKKELMDRGFEIENIDEIDAEVTDQKHPDYEGYDGMVFVIARYKHQQKQKLNSIGK